LDFSLDPLVQKNVTLQGSFSHNWPMWERVLRMLGTGQLDVAPVLGGVWPIKEWEEAFEKMSSGAILKSVIKPE
jgi:alcohol dehydrogenase/L-iditol 2-dehydrogenase